MPGIVTPGRWTIDPSHSSIEFAVGHPVASAFLGRFRGFEGALEVGTAPRAVRGHATVRVETLDTGQRQRDDRLLSEAVLDVDAHPEIGFTLNDVQRIGDDRYRMSGVLAVRGAEQEIALDAKVGASVRDWSGERRTALDLSGRISLRAFGLGRERGVLGVLAGDTVRIIVSLSLVRRGDERSA